MRRILVCVLLWGAVGAWGQVKITNPGLAEKETLKYTETVGSTVRPIEVTVTLTTVGSSQRYEFRTVSADAETVYRLDPLNLLSWSSDSVTTTPEGTVHRSAEYRDLKIKAGPDDLAITDMGSLPLVLRGFPWGQRNSAKLAFVASAPGGGGAGFSFDLTVTGQEKVQAAGRVWDCWHVTTGLGGALAFLVGKSEWWFSTEGSHPLIKAAGPTGGPGSPNRTLLLQSYSAK